MKVQGGKGLGNGSLASEAPDVHVRKRMCTFLPPPSEDIRAELGGKMLHCFISRSATSDHTPLVGRNATSSIASSQRKQFSYATKPQHVDAVHLSKQITSDWILS